MLRALHRKIGISIFIFLLLFIVTGLLLQHVSWFNLEKNYVTASVAEMFYDVTVDTTTDYKTKSRWVSQAGSFLYLDAVPVADVELNSLQGAVESKSYIWVAGDNRLLLLSKQGEVIDEFSVLAGLPGIVTRLGKNAEGNIIIGGLHNNWTTHEDSMDWQPYDRAQIVWSGSGEPLQIPAQLQAATLIHARNHLITWERLLSDFHSGRLFGNAGVIIADMAALLLLFLSATGSILWIRGR